MLKNKTTCPHSILYEWLYLCFLWLPFFVLVYVCWYENFVSALWRLHFPSLFVRVQNVMCVFVCVCLCTCHLSTTTGYRGETSLL